MHKIIKGAMIIILLSFTSIVLFACAAKTGQVVSKEAMPPTNIMEPHCVMYGSYGACKLSIPVSVPQPPKYLLHLSSGATVNVTPQDYNKYQAGQAYP